MQVWVEAARPRTLPAAVAPVLVGTALAVTPNALRAGLALAVALSLQIAVNFANDYFDGVGGIDTEERTGPRRMVASGLVDPPAMKRAIGVALGAAGVFGLVLAALAGWELLLVGAASGLAALGYSGGKRPYASMGLGELFVFVFFGLVATAGTTYVQDERLALAPVIAGTVMGLLATALLVVNNLRDIPTDEATGKRTLAVRIGERQTRRLWVNLIGASLVFHAVLVGAVDDVSHLAGSPWLLVVGLPLFGLLLRRVGTVRTAALGPELIPVLEDTAKTQLLYALLLSAALVAVRIGGAG